MVDKISEAELDRLLGLADDARDDFSFGDDVPCDDPPDDGVPSAGEIPEHANADERERMLPVVLPSNAAIRATPFVWRDPKTIPRRRFLYGTHLIRKFCSATFATTGAGKSSQILVELIALAAGRPLLGTQPKQRCRVWYWNGEEPREEIERRIAAICKYYQIAPEELGSVLR